MRIWKFEPLHFTTRHSPSWCVSTIANRVNCPSLVYTTRYSCLNASCSACLFDSLDTIVHPVHQHWHNMYQIVGLCDKERHKENEDLKTNTPYGQQHSLILYRSGCAGVRFSVFLDSIESGTSRSFRNLLWLASKAFQNDDTNFSISCWDIWAHGFWQDLVLNGKHLRYLHSHCADFVNFLSKCQTNISVGNYLNHM